jgi:DNA-binding NtrC family response regulator
VVATGTLEEVSGQAPPRVRILTYVLSYEDLLAGACWNLRMEQASLAIGRSATPTPPPQPGARELRLADRWMSTDHAMIELGDDGDVIRDLGSRNGTWVDGERITERRLTSGALIEVGHSLLCYRACDARASAALEGDAPRLGPVRTWSPSVAAMVRDLQRIAPSREPILILAETGAGKEVTAAAIHAWSGRDGALCAVDCGAIPESLFESTFFGHRRGAFTGAADSRDGEIVRADGGTLFLDEVANMSATAQAKLLRVIETGQVTAVGAADVRNVDVRWVAATNRDLVAEQMVADSRFRADLLRRLAGHVARIPPLRARREDLGVLTAHLLAEAGATRASIKVGAARALFGSSLPGNVRQLRTVLRSAHLLAGGEAIDLHHLGEGLSTPPSIEPEESGPEPSAGRGGRKAAPGAEEVARALAAAGGNVVRAARARRGPPRPRLRGVEE